MGMEDSNLERIAELNDSGYLNEYLDMFDDIKERELERQRQFNYTYTIGKLIEDTIRNEVSNELSCEPQEFETGDQQNGRCR